MLQVAGARSEVGGGVNQEAGEVERRFRFRLTWGFSL